MHQDYELTGSDLTRYITYRVRFVCDIMIHRTTERVFSRLAILKACVSALMAVCLVFINSFSFFFSKYKI